MAPDGFVVVIGWADLQHYKDRSPPWIKLHTALLESYEFCQLADADKAHLLCIQMLASRLANHVPNDPIWIAKRIGATEPVDLSPLVLAGFLEVVRQPASKPLARRKRSAALEGETEAETETEGSFSLAPYSLIWEEWGGEFPYGEAGKCLKPLETRHGRSQVELGLRGYLTHHTGTQASFASITKFSRTFKQWLPGANGNGAARGRPTQHERNMAIIKSEYERAEHGD